MVGWDYRTYPGVLQIERPMVKVSGQSGGSDVVKGIVKWFVNASPTTIYALDDDQTTANVTRILKSTDTGATWGLSQIMGTSDSPFSANGGIWWKGYFLFASDKHLGYHDGASSWVLDWLDFHTATDTGGNDTDWHPMHQGERDGSLYIGCGRYVALLTEVAGQTFDPTNSATYSFTYNALDIPSDFRIKSLSEVGDYLNLGCWKKVGTTHYPVTVLYPWNYVIRPDAHDAPLFKNKVYGVGAQLNIDNTLFAWMGARAEIYYYNGSEFVKLKKLSKETEAYEIYPGVVKEFNDLAHFGIDNTFNSILPGGIYQFGSHNKQIYPLSLNLPYPLSVGQAASYYVYSLGVCGSSDQILLASWYDGTSEYGIDKLETGSRLSVGSYAETILRHIGTVQNKGHIEKFEIYLDAPLASGQGIDIKYRRNTEAAWTIVKGAYDSTFNYANDGAKSEIYLPFNIDKIVNLQFRIQGYTSGDTTPKIRAILCQ